MGFTYRSVFLFHALLTIKSYFVPVQHLMHDLSNGEHAVFYMSYEPVLVMQSYSCINLQTFD